MKLLEKFVIFWSIIFNLFLITFFFLYFDKMRHTLILNFTEFLFWGFFILIYAIINCFFAIKIFRKTQ